MVRGPGRTPEPLVESPSLLENCFNSALQVSRGNVDPEGSSSPVLGAELSSTIIVGVKDLQYFTIFARPTNGYIGTVMF
jgi:hypothetical protein